MVIDRSVVTTARQPSYRQRLDRVLDHISDHLDEELSLEKLARIAGFSVFHFHRLFAAHVGETLHAHVRRVRVERAASLMRTQPKLSLTDIALEVGFPALSDLSRAFRARFGMAPSRWDRRRALPASKLEREPAATPAALRVQIRTLPRCVFAYTRVFNPYGSPKLLEAYHAIHAWLAHRPGVWAGMSLDDPAVVPAERCRYDLGIVFPLARGGVFDDIAKMRGEHPSPIAPPTPGDLATADLSARRFPAIELATVRCQGDLGVVAVAWNTLYTHWLPGQKRRPAHHPAMELFVRVPDEIGFEQFDLLACVPLA
jgi:AraC family transcriptional regulator